MGAFADLIPTATDYDEMYDVLRKAQPLFPVASAPEEIMRAEALASIKLDMQQELGLLPYDADDMATLDDIAVGQATLLRNVLAMKQMVMVLSHAQVYQPPGSRNYSLLLEARRRYERYRSGFSGLLTSRVGITPAKVRRMRR